MTACMLIFLELVKDIVQLANMVCVCVDYMGDLSLALDPHPPPDTPTATESLEASVLTDDTPVQPPPVSRVPTILKDTSNIQKSQDDISLQRQPGKNTQRTYPASESVFIYEDVYKYIKGTITIG